MDGQFEGYGVYTQQKGEDGSVEISEGMWKAGLLHGLGLIRFVRSALNSFNVEFSHIYAFYKEFIWCMCIHYS